MFLSAFPDWFKYFLFFYFITFIEALLWDALLSITVVTKMLSAKAGGCFLCTLNAIFGKLPYTEKITKSASFILHILTRAKTVVWSALLRFQEVGKLKIKTISSNWGKHLGTHTPHLYFSQHCFKWDFCTEPIYAFSFIGFPFTERDFLVESAEIE